MATVFNSSDFRARPLMSTDPLVIAKATEMLPYVLRPLVSTVNSTKPDATAVQKGWNVVATIFRCGEVTKQNAFRELIANYSASRPDMDMNHQALLKNAKEVGESIKQEAIEAVMATYDSPQAPETIAFYVDTLSAVAAGNLGDVKAALRHVGYGDFALNAGTNVQSIA